MPTTVQLRNAALGALITFLGGLGIGVTVPESCYGEEQPEVTVEEPSAP